MFLQFLQLHLDPASSNTLPASGDGSITQTLRVSNSQHGKVCVLVCVPLKYEKHSSQSVILCVFHWENEKLWACMTVLFGFQKSLVMRMRINYKANDKDVLEEGQINNFPRGLWGNGPTRPLTIELVLIFTVKKHPLSLSCLRENFVTSFRQSGQQHLDSFEWLRLGTLRTLLYTRHFFPGWVSMCTLL